MNSHHFTPQHQTHQRDVPFGVPTSVGRTSLPHYSFYLPLFLHTTKPYQCVNFSNHYFIVGTTTSILKCLCYFRGIGQVQIRYYWVQNTSEKLIEVGVAAYICGLVSVFVLESSASFWQIKNDINFCHTPLWHGFISCSMQSQIYVTAVEADSPLIQQSP